VASPFAMNYSLQRCNFYRERGNDDRARLGLDRSPLMKPRNPSSVQRPGPRQCSQTMSRFSLQGYKGDVTQASASLRATKVPPTRDRSREDNERDPRLSRPTAGVLFRGPISGRARERAGTEEAGVGRGRDRGLP